MNIIDYIDWRGDIPFDCKPFNEVDNLILSELAYVNMDGIVTGDFIFEMSLPRLLAEYRVARHDQKKAFNDPVPMLEKAAYCERYKDIRLGGYMNIFNETDTVQISAVSFRLSEDTIYIAFRGTDNSMTGWKEDFNFGYLSETPGQAEAVAYIKKAALATDCKMYIGGHSKGGNFAVYAAAFCPDTIKNDRLIKVFSNDGPGFKQSVIDSYEYQSILGKIVKIVPEGSIIGTLLFGAEKMEIIKSAGKGMDQHSPYNWQITRDSFEPASDLTYSSVVMDVALDRWVESLDDEQRKVFINSIFDAIEAAGYTSLKDIMSHKIVAYNAIVKASKTLDEENRMIVTQSLKKLASISKDVLWDDTKKKFLSKNRNKKNNSDKS